MKINARLEKLERESDRQKPPLETILLLPKPLNLEERTKAARENSGSKPSIQIVINEDEH
jgi:hypothetical protein